MSDTDITALVERLRELAGQTDAYANNRHHSFVTTQQMGRESAAALKEAADALEACQAERDGIRLDLHDCNNERVSWKARAEDAEAALKETL